MPRIPCKHKLIVISLRCQHLRHALIRHHPNRASRRCITFGLSMVSIADLHPDTNRLLRRLPESDAHETPTLHAEFSAFGGQDFSDSAYCRASGVRQHPVIQLRVIPRSSPARPTHPSSHPSSPFQPDPSSASHAPHAPRAATPPAPPTRHTYRTSWSYSSPRSLPCASPPPF